MLKIFENCNYEITLHILSFFPYCFHSIVKMAVHEQK